MRTMIKLSGGAPPTEFRLFSRGWNDTEKGQFLFDDVAAKSVMAAYESWGVDLAIDLEHQMLDGATTDPDSRDARGWFKLELRNGELWAVDVRWTADGAARLTQKRQRYISPAFEMDRETRRVTKVLNAAITAMPATHNTPSLVAARAAVVRAARSRKRRIGVTRSATTKKANTAGGPKMKYDWMPAIEIIANGDGAGALAELKKFLIASAGGATPSDDPPSTPPEASSADTDGDDSGSADDGSQGPPTQSGPKKKEGLLPPRSSFKHGNPPLKPKADFGNQKQPAPQLSAVEVEMCRDMKCAPEDFLKLRNLRNSIPRHWNK